MGCRMKIRAYHIAGVNQECDCMTCAWTLDSGDRAYEITVDRPVGDPFGDVIECGFCSRTCAEIWNEKHAVCR